MCESLCRGFSFKELWYTHAMWSPVGQQTVKNKWKNVWGELNDSHVRWYLIEADPSVAFHLRLGVNLQLFVRVHRHQHWANVRLSQNTRTHSNMFPRQVICFGKSEEKKIASLRRWGFLWSVSGGSLWRLPHCCNFPAGQSPAPRPCPGRLRRSPSPGALFLQHPPPVGRERRRKETRNKVRGGWDERMYALIHNLR